MRTKTLEHNLDRIFWFIVLLLPLVAYLIINRWQLITFGELLQQYNILTTNVVYDVLSNIFGSTGELPFFDTSSTNSVLIYMSYMVTIELLHIVVDVILFLPRIAVTLLDKASEMGGSKKW